MALSRALLLAFAETFPQGLVVCDPSGVILLANRRARELLAPARRGRALGAAGDWGAALAAVVEELVAHQPGRTRRARVWAAGQGNLQAVACRLANAVALRLTPEPVGEGDLQRALAMLGLDAASARVVARAYRGSSNPALAAALHLPLGQVKWRLHQAYARLGVTRRPDLVRRVDDAVAALAPVPAAPPGAGTGAAPAEAPWLTPAELAMLRDFLDGADVGLAAMDERGRLVWGNHEARRWLPQGEDRGDPAAGDALEQLAGAARRAAEAARGDQVSALRLALPTGGLRATLWPVGPGLWGLELRPERLSRTELPGYLQRCQGLSAREAEVALLISAGRSDGEVARRLGVQAGTVRAINAAVYAKLGIHTRADLMALLDELGADARE